MNFDFNEQEISLEFSQELYKSLVNNIQDLFYRTDMQGRITFISPSVKKLSGFDVAEALGMKMAEEVYAHPDERIALMALLQKDGKVDQFEAELKRKDGSLWWASTNAHFYKDAEGNIAGIEGITRDITKRKNAEIALKKINDELEEIVKQRSQELIQAAKMSSLGEMSASISHEMKQPFAFLILSIPSASNLIKEGDYEGAITMLENSEKILLQSYKIIELMQHFGRKSITEDYQETFVKEIISNVMLLLGKRLKLSNIEIIEDVQKQMKPIICDPVQIEQVLVNLISNAKDAFVGQPKELDRVLTIRSHQEGDMLSIIVEDNAGGIPEDVIPSLFDTFFTTKASGQGTGLGLAISRRIVESHQGTLTVETELGKGTIFNIMLPFPQTEA